MIKIYREFMNLTYTRLLNIFVRRQTLLFLLAGGLVLLSGIWMCLPARGLLAQYYPNAAWEGTPGLSRYDQHFDLEFVGDLIKHAGFPRKHFSIDWKGWIRIDQDGVYRFGTKSDDGSFLRIDQQRVVDNGGLHGSREVWGEIFLKKGMHQMRVSYFNAESRYQLSVFWTPPRGTPTRLSSDALFVEPLSSALAWFSRYPFLFQRLYPALLGGLLVVVFWPNRSDYRGWPPFNVVFNTVIQLVFAAFTVIVLWDNFSMLTAKQPWLIGYLQPEPDRKLSTILRVKGSGDTDDAFCRTLRFLYAGRTLWLPDDELFKQESLFDKAGMGALKFYQPQQEMTSREIRRVHFDIYHRFIYNPYEFRPDGDTLDKAMRNEIDPTTEPKLLFLIMPEDERQTAPDDIVVIPFKRNLYFIPAHQLPERIRGDVYE